MRFWEDCWKFSLKVRKVSARRPNKSMKIEISNTSSSKKFFRLRERQFCQHCLNHFVRKAKVLHQKPQKSIKPFFSHFLPWLQFLGHVQGPSFRACFRKISSKSDNSPLKVKEKVQKQIFLDDFFFQTTVADTYNACSRKRPERFCPVCENLLTKVHKRREK